MNGLLGVGIGFGTDFVLSGFSPGKFAARTMDGLANDVNFFKGVGKFGKNLGKGISQGIKGTVRAARNAFSDSAEDAFARAARNMDYNGRVRTSGRSGADVGDSLASRRTWFADENTETLYRAMSEKEYGRVIENQGLIVRNQGNNYLGVTPDKNYVESLVSRKSGGRKYPVAVEFEVKPGTTQQLIDLGATHGSAINDFPNRPMFTSGMDAVQLKLEKGNVFSLGLGSSSKAVDIFNSAIVNIRRLNR